MWGYKKIKKIKLINFHHVKQQTDSCDLPPPSSYLLLISKMIGLGNL